MSLMPLRYPLTIWILILCVETLHAKPFAISMEGLPLQAEGYDDIAYYTDEAPLCGAANNYDNGKDYENAPDMRDASFERAELARPVKYNVSWSSHNHVPFSDYKQNSWEQQKHRGVSTSKSHQKSFQNVAGAIKNLQDDALGMVRNLSKLKSELASEQNGQECDGGAVDQPKTSWEYFGIPNTEEDYQAPQVDKPINDHDDDFNERNARFIAKAQAAARSFESRIEECKKLLSNAAEVLKENADAAVPNSPYDAAVPNTLYDPAMPNTLCDAAMPNTLYDPAVPKSLYDAAVRLPRQTGLRPGGQGSPTQQTWCYSNNVAVHNSPYDAAVPESLYDAAVPNGPHIQAETYISPYVKNKLESSDKTSDGDVVKYQEIRQTPRSFLYYKPQKKPHCEAAIQRESLAGTSLDFAPISKKRILQCRLAERFELKKLHERKGSQSYRPY